MGMAGAGGWVGRGGGEARLPIPSKCGNTVSKLMQILTYRAYSNRNVCDTIKLLTSSIVVTIIEEVKFVIATIARPMAFILVKPNFIEKKQFFYRQPMT